MAINKLTAESIELRDYSRERELTGTIIKLFHRSTKWSAGKIKLSESSAPAWDREQSFTIAGDIEEGKNVTLRGVWVKDKKYGWQFRAESYEYPMPSTVGGVAGLEQYLSQDAEFRGIGPSKAKLLAEHFETPARLEDALNNDIDTVARVGKLTQEQASELADVWNSRSALNLISTWLAEFGLTAHQIKKIAERYGNNARDILTDNPYCIINDIDGFGFLRTDQIALKMGIDKEHPGRLRACILHTLEEAANNEGHTYIERKSLVDSTLRNLYLDSLNAKRIINNSIDDLCAKNELCSEMVGDKEYVSLAWLYHQELALLEWFRDYARQPVLYRGAPLDASTLISAAVSQLNCTLESAQRESVEAALTHKISIMTGGAGTGKSFTIKTIQHIFKSLDMTVGVCAPTGKAAKRLANDGMRTARTIHRLLEYSPREGGFTYNSSNPLPYDVVIVDEVSMCAVPLLYSLFSAVNLSRTSVVLVGDANQLPPIGPGNVLRDCVDHNIVPTTRLTVCHRNAGKLKTNCADILTGKLHREPSKKNPDDPRYEWFVVNDRTEPEEVVELCRLLMREQFHAWKYDPISECQIIIPQRTGAIGVNRLNLELQRVWQKTKYNRDLPAVAWDGKNIKTRPQFYQGDKVMQIKNDYKLDGDHGGVMNGTQGVIQDIVNRDGSKYLLVKFEDRRHLVEIEYGSDQMDHIALSYACTVHKVQGSQYECVVSIVHRSHAYMLSRNLLYTAVTRARSSSIVIGDPVGIRRAVRTITSMQRNTWLSLLALAGGIPNAQEAHADA